MGELLKMEQISKQFGGVFANKNINLSVNEGEVHTLLGENGAGKSTLMNILIGLYQPSGGKIYLREKQVRIDTPRTAVKMGIGMVHQHFMLVEAMTVFENIILGTSQDRSLFIKEESLKKKILELSARYELDVELDKAITDISVGAQQRVEILKALYRGADLLILDEPTAALTDIEVQGLFKIIKKLISERKSVIFISHKMREVLSISDRITILRAGETVTTVNRGEADGAGLANLMIGREMKPGIYEKKVSTAEAVLDFESVSYCKHSKHNGLNGVSFTVKKGEILGIAGVDGNGQSQIAQIATGNLMPDQGTVRLHSKSVRIFKPAAFIHEHVAHIPEDRNRMGLVGNMTVEENLVLKDTDQPEFSHARGLCLKRREISRFALTMQQQNDIRCSSVRQEARNLSGGNQQKIILARELHKNPKLLVAVHPTRGLDIGAAQFVHDMMIAQRDEGCGILLISADFDEVLKLSDRIIVMFEGQVMGTYPGQDPPIEEISLAMAGK